MSKLYGYDEVIFEGHEHYQKGSYRNKCVIIQSSGYQTLSIPLSKGKNEKKPIKEVEIHDAENWRRLHWQSIKTAYGRSPYFDYYGDEIKAILMLEHSYLFEYNLAVLQKVCLLIGLELNHSISEDYADKIEAGVDDLRALIKPNRTFEEQDQNYTAVPYSQVFEDRLGFSKNPSILDLIFCAGPAAILVLENSIIK